jgi:hypothetical protein
MSIEIRVSNNNISSSYVDLKSFTIDLHSSGQWLLLSNVVTNKASERHSLEKRIQLSDRNRMAAQSNSPLPTVSAKFSKKAGTLTLHVRFVE